MTELFENFVNGLDGDGVPDEVDLSRLMDILTGEAAPEPVVVLTPLTRLHLRPKRPLRPSSYVLWDTGSARALVVLAGAVVAFPLWLAFLWVVLGG